MLIFRQPSSRPKLSGKWSALVLFVCFAVSAVAIPVAAHLPKWVEFEIVAGVWWLVWTLVLAYLLFNAHEVDDDVDPPEFRWNRARETAGDWDGCGTILAIEGIQDAGCCLASLGEIGLWIALVALAVLGVVVSVEFLIPGLAFLFYLAIRGMLARAVNPARSCEDNAPLALFWGMIWATVYTAPIALAIWLIKTLVMKAPA